MQVSKKVNESIPRKLMDRRKDGRKEGQTDPILYNPSCRGREFNNLSSVSDWWEYIKSYFKENAEIFSKTSILQF